MYNIMNILKMMMWFGFVGLQCCSASRPGLQWAEHSSAPHTTHSGGSNNRQRQVKWCDVQIRTLLPCAEPDQERKGLSKTDIYHGGWGGNYLVRIHQRETQQAGS